MLIVTGGVLKYLNWAEKDDEPLNRFFRVLNQMLDNAPFEPIWRSDEPRQFLTEEEKYSFRRPVWKLISKTIVVPGSAKTATLEEKVEWFSHEMFLCIQYRRYEAELSTFRTNVEKLKLSFTTAEMADSKSYDVVVDGRFIDRGLEAITTVKTVITKINKKLSPKKHSKIN